MGTDWRIRHDLSGWKVTIRTRYCMDCGKPNLNTKEGFFKLTLSNGEKHYYTSRIDISLCPDCFKHMKLLVNDEKPDLMDEYNTKYKEAMVRGIERGNKQ
jgi:hypothetical protein